jgi:hypothetical protein
MLRFIYNILLLLDQALNVLLLGDPSETVSSRCGRAMASDRPILFARLLTKLINWIFGRLVGQRNHSIESIDYDENFKYEIWSWIKK